MTEDEARAALAAFDGLGGLERWIAEQRPWQAIPAGWTVPGKLQGWRFRWSPRQAACASSCPCAGASRRCGSCPPRGSDLRGLVGEAEVVNVEVGGAPANDTVEGGTHPGGIVPCAAQAKGTVGRLLKHEIDRTGTVPP